MNTIFMKKDDPKSLRWWWNMTPREVIWKFDMEGAEFKDKSWFLNEKAYEALEATENSFIKSEAYGEGFLSEEHSDYMWHTNTDEFGDLLWEIYDKSFKNQISSLKKFRLFAKWVLMGTYVETPYEVDRDALLREGEVSFMVDLLESFDIITDLNRNVEELDTASEKMLDGLLFKIWRDENPRDDLD